MLFRTSRKQKHEILEMAFIVAVIQPLMVVPQIAVIFSQHSAAAVSLLSWVMFLVFNALNFLYGLTFKIKPLIIGNALWVVVDAIVVAGILMYR